MTSSDMLSFYTTWRAFFFNFIMIINFLIICEFYLEISGNKWRVMLFLCIIVRYKFLLSIEPIFLRRIQRKNFKPNFFNWWNCLFSVMENRKDFCVGSADAKLFFKDYILKNKNFLEFRWIFGIFKIYWIFLWGTHPWSTDQTLH